jgi:hypothetical protein
MRLRPGLRVLRRDDSEVQIGTDPRWAVLLTGLGPGEADLLQLLDADPDLERLVARAPECGVPIPRAAELCGALQVADLTCRIPKRAEPLVRGGAAADAVAWSLLRDDGDGAGLVRARGHRTVGIVGLGRLGLTVAVTLATAGVGTVLLADDELVTSVDVGAAGYRMGDVGGGRLVAATRVLHDVAPGIRTEPADGVAPDVVVLVERDAVDPATALALVTAGTTHLSVVVREADAVVGPLVVPGAGPCLRCVDLHRVDVDPAWPLVAAQLVSRRAAMAALSGEAGVLAGVCGALAAAEVLAHLDGGSPATRGASYEVTLPDVAPRRRQWSVHPDCGCTAVTSHAQL